MNKKRITGVLLALAMLLSGCAKSSDTGNTENADKWWNNIYSSANSEESDAASDGTQKQEYSNEPGIVIPDSVRNANNTPTVSLTDKVVIESNTYLNKFVGAPLYNCTDDTVIDFTLPADDLSVYAYVDDPNSILSFNDKIKKSCNVTGQKLTIGELIENNLFSDVNGFNLNNEEAIEKQRSRMSRNLYSCIIVVVEAENDDGFTAKQAMYAIPFTRKGSMDVPDVSFNLDSGTLVFDEDTEVVEYEAPEIPDGYNCTEYQRALYELTDFDYDVYKTCFNALETEDDFEKNVGPAGTGLIVSPDYSGELQRMAFRAYDKATGEFSSWCTIDYSQFESVIIDDISTPSPSSSAELSAESVDEWLECIPTQSTITTVSGSQYSVPATFLLIDDDANTDVADHLVAPGSYSVDGEVREGWALECIIGVRNSANQINIFFKNQDFSFLRFPESFTLDQCVECWDALQERQEFLTEIWNEEQSKTFGAMDVKVSGAGRRSSCESFELLSLCESSDINDYSGSFDRKYSKDEDSAETVSEVEQTTTETEPVQTTTTAAPAHTTTTTEPVQTTTTAEPEPEESVESISTKYSDLSLLQEAINNYKDGDTCLTIDMGYGDIKFNGEDLGQMVAAYYMFNHEESFSIPIAFFKMDNYYDPVTGTYAYIDHVPETVTTQNPMVTYYIGNSTVHRNSISETYDFSDVVYTTDRDTIMKWQPAEYAKAKEIADSIKSMNLSDRDAFAEINKVLCNMAEYNYTAYEEVGKYRKDIIGKSEKTQAAWAPYGVLCYNTGVCYSYAQAYHLICDIMDLPCISITGTTGGGGHIWNKVEINGEWYIVDATGNDRDPNNFLFNSLDLIPDYVGNLCPFDRGSWYSKPNANLQYTSTDGSKDAWDKGNIISVSSTDELLDYVKSDWKLTDGKYGDYSVKYYAVRVDFDFGAAAMSQEEIENTWHEVLAELESEGKVPECGWYYGFDKNVFYFFYYNQ